ncbi:DUF2715 domain-containing protein [Treponema pedis]|uniref:Outer membrane protein beta-barrel domain-containing protein n=2 Tax=Treponema pedis TaxID=409322 RepID=S6A8J4_9SPIR|nr:DUF2715 domain-containing protein [Treponema pedis]AGT43934.1 hypothetical protein TPE_1439 [Treponema pedis str. T A4]QOW61774.1 DUF2715 domain-containing protein [Treponema pedis]
MKKKIILITVFSVLLAGALSAKTIGLNLEVGALYTNHQLHHFWKGTNSDGFRHHSNRYKHMGGFNIGLSYDLPKNWAIYGTTMFAFNSIFVNDTQFGIGYNFKPGKGFNLFLGGAFAVGGSKFTVTHSNVTKEIFKSTNIGGGLKLTASYMFTRQFGIYFGACANYYKPVSGYVLGVEQSSDRLPDMAQSLNAMAGLRVYF